MLEVPIPLGRYMAFAELAKGGMATVYLGRLQGELGFGRTVAIKRLHPHLASEPEFVTMFLDEARLAARVQHPNVVPTLDVVSQGSELFLVMEYVRGESLHGLLRILHKRGESLPLEVVSAIVGGALAGLHAAHEAVGEDGHPLEIVHRDISPHNLLVGVDGVTRVLDFGVAKAVTRLQTTREGQLKGKIPYMAPEQVGGETSRRTDVYAMGVVLWEALVGRRLFAGETELQILQAVLEPKIRPPSAFRREVPPALDAIVMRALAKDPAARFATAAMMLEALEHAVRPASARVVGALVEDRARELLSKRSTMIAQIESAGSSPSKPDVLRHIQGGLSGPIPAVSSSDVLTTVTASTASHTLAEPVPLPPARRWPWLALGGALAGVLVLLGGGLFVVGRMSAGEPRTGPAPVVSVAAAPAVPAEPAEPVAPPPIAASAVVAPVAVHDAGVSHAKKPPAQPGRGHTAPTATGLRVEDITR